MLHHYNDMQIPCWEKNPRACAWRPHHHYKNLAGASPSIGMQWRPYHHYNNLAGASPSIGLEWPVIYKIGCKNIEDHYHHYNNLAGASPIRPMSQPIILTSTAIPIQLH